MELIKDINKVTYDEFYDEERLFALLYHYELTKYGSSWKVLVNERNKLSLTFLDNNDINISKYFYKFDDLDEIRDYITNLIKYSRLEKGIECYLDKKPLDKEDFENLIKNNSLEKAFILENKSFELFKDIDDYIPLIIEEFFLNSLFDLESKMTKLLSWQGDNWSKIFYDIEEEFQMLLAKMNSTYIDDEWISIPIYMEAGGLGSDYLAKCNKNFGELEELAIKKGLIR